MADDTTGDGWATAAALFASALGSAYSSQQAADQYNAGQNAAIDSTSRLMGQARNDAVSLFNSGRDAGKQGLGSALEFYQQGAPARRDAFTQGNVAAQGVAQQGGIQANNAILGLPVDMSYANPQKINAGQLPDAKAVMGGGLGLGANAGGQSGQVNTQVPGSPSPAAPASIGGLGGALGTISAAQAYNNRPEGAGMPNEDGEGGGLMGRVGEWIGNNWDDALGAAGGFALGGPIGAKMGAQFANWARDQVQGTPTVSTVDAAPGETLPAYQPGQSAPGESAPAESGPDMGMEGNTSAPAAPGANTPTAPNTQWQRASDLASGGLMRDAQNQEMSQSNLEAVLGAGSRGQVVGNAYSSSANSAARAAQDWLARYGVEQGDQMVSYLVPWLMKQASDGTSFADALNTVTPNEIERRIFASQQKRA